MRGEVLPKLPISYEQMRSLLLDAIVNGDTEAKQASGGWQLNRLRTAVANMAITRGVVPSASPSVQNQFRGQSFLVDQGNHLSDGDMTRVRNIIWDLIIEGVLRPGLETSGGDTLPNFHITEFGRHVLSGQSPSAYDPDGYLKRINADIPNVDDVILTYLSESLHTFRIGCLLSSTVTLGCASEQALLLLIEAYASKLPTGAVQDKFVKATEGKMIKTQYDEFSKMLEGHLRGKLPKPLREEIDTALNGIFPMLRGLRNRTGHPTGSTVSREVAYANLMVFPTMLKHLYGIMDWLPTASL